MATNLSTPISIGNHLPEAAALPPVPVLENGFVQLYQRLASSLRTRIQNGEFTERGLARVVGVSQPHLHHVLAGKRQFSAEMADQVMRRLQLNVDNLVAERAASAAGLQ
jgi:predicted XRE-type DNA-binding protein